MIYRSSISITFIFFYVKVLFIQLVMELSLVSELRKRVQDVNKTVQILKFQNNLGNMPLS